MGTEAAQVFRGFARKIIVTILRHRAVLLLDGYRIFATIGAVANDYTNAKGETMTANAIEALAQWIWKALKVDCADEMTWVLERLELACVAADQGNFRRALLWIASAAEKVFGYRSEAYQGFARLYPEAA